ncbi:tripartite tricarboxylate transporter substrate binding protein [Phreatobacter aquaticus]|uniref:Tripartite tricarboxylate transporter substrate binding protein n=1 Tax=Phreatobacter aquaticus TaxID=2570229 RepID=A0A4D7QBN5_9HYPH|nr:tripartite tricarboxylate transporter substrate binding protein [Phreatobacter aquaticus]QCK84558.1 tripartite tricarboxylate transporter substrate binding protein [Phreatobacter aquaticus]
MTATISRRSLTAAALGLIATGVPARAQAYPSRPIRLLVPFPPGGPTDLVARVLAEKMGELLGQAFVIDNRPGANGNIASEGAAKADPDGYTVLYNTSAIALSPSLYARLNYDVVSDLEPVCLTAVVPLVLAVHPSVPAQTVAEFVAYAKANPGKLNYGSAGAGNVTHLGAALFLKSQGIEAVHVPFRGSAPALNALAGGHVQFIADTVNSAHPLITSGHLRALAILGTRRTPVLPNVPSLTEAGIDSKDIGAWQGIMVPARTPADLVAKLNAAALAALADPAVKAKLAVQGAEPLGSTPAAYGTYVRDEIVRWAEVVKASGVRIE